MSRSACFRRVIIKMPFTGYVYLYLFRCSMLVSVTRVQAQRGGRIWTGSYVAFFFNIKEGEISRQDILLLYFEDHVSGYQALGRRDVHWNPPETVCGASDGVGRRGPSTFLLLRGGTCRFRAYCPCLLSNARIRFMVLDRTEGNHTK